MSSTRPNPPAASAHRSTTAIDWLGAEPSAARLLRTAHRLRAAQDLLEQSLPGALGQRARVAQIHATRMLVFVPSPASAARLRQMTTRTVAHFEQAGWPIKEIVIRVDAARHAPPAGTQPARTAHLGEAGVRAFRALQQELTPGPLADAVARLLRHHRDDAAG